MAFCYFLKKVISLKFENPALQCYFNVLYYLRQLLTSILSGLLLYLETWINLEFDNLGIKNLEFQTFLSCSVVKLQSDTKNISYK